MTAIRAALGELRRRPLFAAGAVVLVISTLLSAGASAVAARAQHAAEAQNERTEAQNEQLEQIVEDLQADRELAEARQCKSSWEGRTGVRSLIDGLVAASTNADPARVAAFRADMARRLPDPTCDLDEALERIERAEAPPPHRRPPRAPPD